MAAETRLGGAKRRWTKEDSKAYYIIEPKIRKRVNFEDIEVEGELISSGVSYK
jgi:hypothetical protein